MRGVESTGFETTSDRSRLANALDAGIIASYLAWKTWLPGSDTTVPVLFHTGFRHRSLRAFSAEKRGNILPPYPMIEVFEMALQKIEPA